METCSSMQTPVFGSSRARGSSTLVEADQNATNAPPVQPSRHTPLALLHGRSNSRVFRATLKDHCFSIVHPIAERGGPSRESICEPVINGIVSDGRYACESSELKRNRAFGNSHRR